MQLSLEVVVVPVADVDRAKEFYAEKVGFNLDHDNHVTDTFRVVQLTPPGSACTIVVQSYMPGADEQPVPGSLKGLQLVTDDLRATHAELTRRGLDLSPVQVMDGGQWREATEDDDLNYAGFAFFRDPDGNSWAIQEVSKRVG